MADNMGIRIIANDFSALQSAITSGNYTQYHYLKSQYGSSLSYAQVPDGRIVEGEAVGKAGAGAELKPRLQPVAVELYAMCSDSLEAALEAAEPGKLKLSMQDWRSGPHRKLVRNAPLSSTPKPR